MRLFHSLRFFYYDRNVCPVRLCTKHTYTQEYALLMNILLDIFAEFLDKIDSFSSKSNLNSNHQENGNDNDQTGKSSHRKMNGNANNVRAHRMFSRILNLRFFSRNRKFSVFSFFCAVSRSFRLRSK